MSEADTEDKPVRRMDAPIRLAYTYTPGVAQSAFLRALVDARILGQRCSRCTKVYVPPRGSCARCGIAISETLELSDTGVVTAFCVVNIPFAGQAVECPYVSASITFDGADVPIFHLVQEIDPSLARVGMRVQAVWLPADEREPTMTSIRYFRPTGEPDEPIREPNPDA